MLIRRLFSATLNRVVSVCILDQRKKATTAQNQKVESCTNTMYSTIPCLPGYTSVCSETGSYIHTMYLTNIMKAHLTHRFL